MLHSNVLRKIGTISRIVASRSDQKFKKYDLQKGQHIFVVRICEHPGLNLMELTQMLNVDKSTTTKAVQKLEKAGYVRKAHPDDNRKSLSLYPTEQAKQVYEALLAEENVQVDLCFDGFSEAEKKQALEFLERMCRNIETYR